MYASIVSFINHESKNMDNQKFNCTTLSFFSHNGHLLIKLLFLNYYAQERKWTKNFWCNICGKTIMLDRFFQRLIALLATCSKPERWLQIVFCLRLEHYVIKDWQNYGQYHRKHILSFVTKHSCVGRNKWVTSELSFSEAWIRCE